MKGDRYTPVERISRSLAGQPLDRIPFMLPATFYPAKLMGMSIQEYFSKAEHIVEGQLRFRKLSGHDGFLSVTYTAAEFAAWGGETLFFEDGPPNCGAPIAKSVTEIEQLQAPRVLDSPELVKELKVISLLKEASKGEIPIFAMVISPFSLPIIQLGFELYLELFIEQPKVLEHLYKINQGFCIEWANSQLAAGASGICYVDPMASSDLIPLKSYVERGLPLAQQTIKEIKGAVAYGLAGSRVMPVLPYLLESGASSIGISALDDLAKARKQVASSVALSGNLNGLLLCRWTEKEVTAAVKNAIVAGSGGAFLLTEHHGELPWFVPVENIAAIGQAVRNWGTFPLDWVKNNAG